MVCIRFILTYSLSFADEVELLKNGGFSSEAILKDEAINENGEYEDIVRLSILKP